MGSVNAWCGSGISMACPGGWWTIFDGLHTLFSWKNKGFHSQWCWIKWVPLFVSGRCTKIGKDLEQSLNHIWEETTQTGLKEWGDSLKWFWESRTQISEQIQRSQCLDPRNQKSSVLNFTPSYFIPSSLMVLAWQLSSLRLLHLMRKSKLPALGYYILKTSSSKERSLEPLEFKGVPWMIHPSSPVQP